jgi:tetratricopeptide (TPR) repeat protein
MIPQTARIRFDSASFLLLCGLSGALAFQGGCAIVGSSTGSDGATVSGGTSCVGVCTNISEQTIKELKSLGITEAALNRFFEDLGRNNVPPKDLDHELRDIAKNYLDLKTKLATFSSEDPEVTALIQQARQAVEAVNFPLAERLFNEASQRDEQVAQRLLQFATTRLTSAAATQAANGDLQVVQLNFVKAEAYYQKALQLLPPSDKAHRGQYLVSLGISLQEAGIRTKGADTQKVLRKSVAAYRDALTVYTKEQFPQDWAMTQNNLGNVLGNQGTRTGGEAGTRLLAEAVQAYRDALTVYTKEQFPQDWAMTQNNLGNVLGNQGTRTGGEAGTRLLAEAVQAYRDALTVRTKEQLPQQWATTQNNLGNVLGNQGIRTGGEAGTRLLAEAVQAYRDTLTVRSKEQLPQDWATAQNNLGSVLGNQGTRTGGEAGKALIREAIHAYELALEVRTKEALPVQWEQTMGNLALAKKALEDTR